MNKITPPSEESLWIDGGDGFEYTTVNDVIFFRTKGSIGDYLIYNKLLDQKLPDHVQEKNKVCRLINDLSMGKLNWQLQVDGVVIPFKMRSNAEYFANLYSNLGYEIKWEVYPTPKEAKYSSKYLKLFI